MNGSPVTPLVRTAEARLPSSEQIRLHLKQILESKQFVRSQRLRRFLTFTVELTLTGETDRIKEYALGRDVFDRDERYDPRVDSIVRVEARRLRRKLDEYYQAEGTREPVRIEFQQGSYIPSFKYAAGPGPTLLPFPSQPRPLSPSTIAVLPFRNLSPDPAIELFCDGITEEILSTLATVPQLNVVARTSVFHFKNSSSDVREVGEQLGAGTIIEGSVRGSGERLRVAVQAIEASSGVVIWSGSFDRDVSDIFAVQDEIARAIADSLRVSVAPHHEIAPGTRTVEAYSAYLKGCHFWNHVSQSGVEAALKEFNRSIELFPGYAPAHVGLANAYGMLTFWSVIPPGLGIARCQESALEAMHLDDSVSGAYAILGALTSCAEWQWREGESLLKRAIELQPNNMTAHTYYALHLICEGRFAEVMSSLDKSFQLDPLSPWSFRNQGWYFYFTRQYDLAVHALTAALALDPNFREAQFILAYAYLRAGRHDEAIAQLLALPAGPYQATRWGALGEAYAYAGNAAKAREALHELDVVSQSEYVSPINRAAIHGGLGDWDGMFEQLEEAWETHCPWICLLKVDPRYDPVKKDTRYLSLLARVNLA